MVPYPQVSRATFSNYSIGYDLLVSDMFLDTTGSYFVWLLNGECIFPMELATAVAEAIRVYLRENRSAGDTAEGIWRWWLTGLRNKVDVEMVEMALQELVSHGEIGKRILASGATFYYGLDQKSQSQS